MASAAHGQEIATYRWQVRQDRIIDRTWAIKRQEAVILEPSYANASGPVDLEAVYEVKLRWRPYGSTNAYAYATDGQVTAAASGTVQCVWLPAYAADGSEVYEYEIGLKSEAGQNLRAGGLLNMVGSLADQPATPLPSTLIPFDWSLITEHLNTASAPFATTSTVAALDACVTGVETGKLDKTDATYTNTVALAAGALQAETDTLQTITDRGATTTNTITAAGFVQDGTHLMTEISGKIAGKQSDYDTAIIKAAGAAQLSATNDFTGTDNSFQTLLTVKDDGTTGGRVQLNDPGYSGYRQGIGSSNDQMYPAQNPTLGYLYRWTDIGGLWPLYDSGNFVAGTHYLAPAALSAYVPRIETNGWEVGSHTGLAVASVVVTQVWSVAQYPLALTNAAAFDAAGTAAALSNVLGSAAFTAATNYAELATNNTFAEGTTNIFDVIQTSTNGAPTGTVRLWDGCIQLGYLNNQHSIVSNSVGSIGLGAVTITNTANAIVAGHGQTSHGDGSVTAGGGFWTTNTSSLGNVSIVGNITASGAITGATAKVSGTATANAFGTTGLTPTSGQAYAASIRTTGRVGIGADLNSLAQMYLTSSYTYAMILNHVSQPLLAFHTNGTLVSSIGGTAGGMTFYRGAGNTTSMVLGGDGNFGIGPDTTPDYNMDVQGTLGVDGLATLFSNLTVSGSITAGNGINATNTWVDLNSVTNTQIIIGGIMTSWTQAGPP